MESPTKSKNKVKGCAAGNFFFVCQVILQNTQTGITITP